MSSPDPFRAELFAPCGMNCAVCYKYLSAKKPCAGCQAGETGKPAHCRACAIKDCRKEQDVIHCFACPRFPCKRIQNLDRTYRTRYKVSLIEQGEQVRAYGMDTFLTAERERWTCPECGGVISLHDRICSGCGTPCKK